ncbi:WGR domain-containing protein [Celeribacter baekdonensis]|uniref:WGR domain-containing protein n=1 Tax=Celeribacter baekdonensis TaxID=875171 RepID=UPI00190233BC|nr:WGR domain-containing protein [Celeribacter baekdonensis]
MLNWWTPLPCVASRCRVGHWPTGANAPGSAPHLNANDSRPLRARCDARLLPHLRVEWWNIPLESGLVQVRLEKIVPFKRQRRFYALSIDQTLFGEWCLIREWGRIGAIGGQKRGAYLATQDDALRALEGIKRAKNRRGYATIPVQLELI